MKCRRVKSKIEEIMVRERGVSVFVRTKLHSLAAPRECPFTGKGLEQNGREAGNKEGRKEGS